MTRSNQAAGLPYITGIMVLNESQTGFVKAIRTRIRITAWRTGAASGVCAKHMADPDSETIAVVGLGVQGARTPSHCWRPWPKVSIIKVYDNFPWAGGEIPRLHHPFLKEPGSFRAARSRKRSRMPTSSTCTPIVANPQRFVRTEG